MHEDGLDYIPVKHRCDQCGQWFWSDEIVFFVGPDRGLWCQYCQEEYDADMQAHVGEGNSEDGQ